MSQPLHEQVNEILHEAETASDSMLTDDGDSSETDLLETANRASEVLESSDPDDLLAAVGLDELPDGSEPDSIPAAIAQGDPEQVDALQRLLHLANLADEAEGDALEGAVGAIQQSTNDGESADDSETVPDDGDAAEDAVDEDADDSESGVVRDAIETVTGGEDAESDGESGAREAVESVAEGVSEASGIADAIGHDDGDEAEGGDDTDSADETSDDIGDQLRSAMESTFSDVSDDLEGLQERLQDASASSVGSDADDAAETDAANGKIDDEDAAEREAADEDAAEREAADEDDGLLDADPGSDRDGGTPGGATRHSTMAPPPSKRADMKGTARHSTMPDRY